MSALGSLGPSGARAVAADRDLVEAIRAALASIDPARPCDRAAEAIALFGGSRSASGLARLAIRLGRPPAEAVFDWAAAADHCRLAWLRGLYLSRASLRLAGGRTHLEFVVPAETAPLLAAHVAELELPASWRIRRGLGVVTWKNGEVVGTFLRRIGAGAALLELEARQVGRAMRGDLNRVINAESANLQRAVVAAARQLEAIAQLDADGRLDQQPKAVRLIADARRTTPESTITELAERLELNRSTVQRALERLERVALHPEDGEGRPGRRRRPRPTESASRVSNRSSWRAAAPSPGPAPLA